MHILTIFSKAAEDRSSSELAIVARECETIPFFQQFRRDQRLAIYRDLAVVEAPRDTVIVREGARGDSLFIIFTGTCRMLKRPEGSTSSRASNALRCDGGTEPFLLGVPPSPSGRAKRSADALGTEICILEPGDAFVSPLLQEGGRRNASVVSVADSILFTLTREGFMEVREQCGTIHRSLDAVFVREFALICRYVTDVRA
jgi:CRP-like cAMP-binding protein